MKNFFKMMAMVLAIGFFSACNKDNDQVIDAATQSYTDLIETELAQYSNVEGIGEAKKVLMAFNKTLSQTNASLNRYEIGTLFTENAAAAGLNVYVDYSTYKASLNAQGKIPSVPTELLNLVGEMADLAMANTVEEYIVNVDALIQKTRNSGLSLVEKGGVIISLVTLKIIGKIIQAVNRDNPDLVEDPNAKWRKYLKCSIRSIASGFAGALPACSQGSEVVGGIGGLFGGQGQAIGSIVGCSVGAVIAGIKGLTETAIQCSKDEGLTDKK